MTLSKETNKLLKECFYIIVVISVMAFMINLFNPNGYVFVSTETLRNKQMVHISLEEAKNKQQYNIALFIDSRETREFIKKHISGSISIPASPESLSLEKIKTNFSKLESPLEIIIYCDGASCGKSQILGKRLIELGYKNHIYLLEGGIPDWEQAGYPLEINKEGNK